MTMPIQIKTMTAIEQDILDFLAKGEEGLAYSSREIAEGVGSAESTARKYLSSLYNNGEVKRGKVRGRNKTFYYFV